MSFKLFSVFKSRFLPCRTPSAKVADVKLWYSFPSNREERLKDDAKACQEKVEEIRKGWSIVNQKVVHSELQSVLDSQQQLCAAVIEDKKKLIRELQWVNYTQMSKSMISWSLHLYLKAIVYNLVPFSALCRTGAPGQRGWVFEELEKARWGDQTDARQDAATVSKPVQGLQRGAHTTSGRTRSESQRSFKWFLVHLNQWADHIFALFHFDFLFLTPLSYG